MKLLHVFQMGEGVEAGAGAAFQSCEELGDKLSPSHSKALNPFISVSHTDNYGQIDGLVKAVS